MIKLYRLIGIIVLLRLVPRDCWLVVVLGQNECCHGRSDVKRFLFCCLFLDARARKRFLIDLRSDFCRKGAPTLNFEKYLQNTFLHVRIKLEWSNRPNTLSGIPSVYWATYIYIEYYLDHRKVFCKSHFLKMTFMRALRGETTRKF